MKKTLLITVLFITVSFQVFAGLESACFINVESNVFSVIAFKQLQVLNLREISRSEDISVASDDTQTRGGQSEWLSVSFDMAIEDIQIKYLPTESKVNFGAEENTLLMLLSSCAMGGDKYNGSILKDFLNSEGLNSNTINISNSSGEYTGVGFQIGGTLTVLNSENVISGAKTSSIRNEVTYL